MILLTKYNVFEYLNYLRANKIICNLNLSVFDIQISNVESDSRNLVYFIKVNENNYLIKQFFKDGDFNENAFKTELGFYSNIYSNKIVFSDENHKIIIYKKIINSFTFYNAPKLFAKGEQKYSESILDNIANELNNIHIINSTSSNIASFRNFKIELLSHILLELNREYLKSFNFDSIIHTDLHANNILISKDLSVNIIDWERTSIGDRYVDIAYIILNIILKKDAMFFTSNSIEEFEKPIKYYTKYFIGKITDINVEKLKIFTKVLAHGIIADMNNIYENKIANILT